MQEPRGISPDHAPVSAWRPWHAPVAALAFIPLIGASLFASTIVHAPNPLAAPAQLSPLSAPGWRILGAPENWSPAMNADTRLDLTYQQDRQRVYVSIGYLAQDRPSREIVTVENRAADGDAWRKIASKPEVVYLFGRSEPVMLEVLAGSERRRLLVATVYWRDDQIYIDKVRFKLAQMRDKLQGRNPPGGVIFIASDYAGEPEQALRRLRAFTSDVEGFSAWRARNGGAS